MPQITTNVAQTREDDYPSKGNTIRKGLPLVTIAGAVGKTSTGWVLVKLLESAGLEVGARLSGGVYVDTILRPDEIHAWELATFAARAREIDVLVQEVPSVLARNIRPGSVGTAVFTSICGSDDQCRRDESSARDRTAAEAIAAAVRPDGRIVINADDPMIVDAVALGQGKRVYYALNGANPILRSHLAESGDAAWIQNGWIKVQIDGRQFRILRVGDLPASLGGHLLFQVQNTLAAVAAALPLITTGIDPGVSLLGLNTNDPKHQGGLREIDTRKGTILVDRPVSIQSVRQLARAIRSSGPRRVIVALDDFATFSEKDAVEAARVIGSVAGIVILIGDKANHERTELLKHGLMRSDTPPAVIFRNEMDAAVAYARSQLEDRDLALVLNPRSNARSSAPSTPGSYGSTAKR